MSEIKEHLEYFTRLDHPMPLYKFLAENGKTYTINQDTFAMPRGEPKQCYMNATRLAMDRRDLTYVEGKVSVYGIPVDHAWCVDAAGNVIDLTLDLPIDGGEEGMARVREYFGVPFRTEYLLRAALVNRVYGLLDGFHARATLPKLVELGLDAGQDWLLAQKLRRNGRLAVPRQKRAKSARALALAALILLPHDLQAQQPRGQETVYGADGSVRAKIAPGSNGTTTVYGADGRVEARTTRGSDGTVTVYGSDGRVIERIAPGGKR